jgi:transketolase
VAPSRIDPASLRRSILETAYHAGVGHIGCALSVADILAALYSGVLNLPALDHPDRDRFVLSKGHGALALYAALAATGHMPAASLEGYCADGSDLGVHPSRKLPGVDFSTGSLGHGLSYGAGAALAARMQPSSRRVFVLLSDAELNAGSTWEAVMFAAQHRLGRLTAVVDLNGQQAFGATRDVLDLEPVAERFRAFGWTAVEVDGHDARALEQALNVPAAAHAAPRAILARTIFGRGVSFMEGQLAWHYLPMNAEQFACAMRENGGGAT